MKNRVSRRRFLKTGALAALGGWAIPNIIPARVLGLEGATPPSEKIGVGLIGTGGRGGGYADGTKKYYAGTQGYNNHEHARVVAVCDPIKIRREVAMKTFSVEKSYNDFRELLQDPAVDAVHISTPDHWHVPIALAAAKAGKHVFVEKPLGLTIEQDLAARKIAKKFGRVFQYGAQNRSMPQVKMATELVLNGHIGELKEIYVWALQGQRGGKCEPLPVPDGYDYDLWLGPAPEAPFCYNRNLKEGFANPIFYIYDYSLGMIAGWGAHVLHPLQWWADRAGWGIPVRYEGSGKWDPQNLWNCLHHWDLTCTYANGFSLRFMDAMKARDVLAEKHFGGKIGGGIGLLYVGTKGRVWLAGQSNSWQLEPESLIEKAKEPGPIRVPMLPGNQLVSQYIEAIRQRTDTTAVLESAIQSDICNQLCDIAARVGRPVTWDPAKETIVGDAEAIKMMSRPMRAPYDQLLNV